MTFDPTKPVQQRNGNPARIICTNMRGRWPIVALIGDELGDESVSAFRADGRAPYDHQNSSLDLVNIPARTSLWQNVYANGNGGSYPSREIADFERRSDRLAVVEFFIEDGKPVDVRLHPVEGSK